ncbi:MAG: hypothetical protein ABJL35_05925 [Parasphingorhabdus sp.]|uniref:hypothetical protein n=3 Tax=Parasphingorhabdus sp. TaxID=2709688 RepID=UPI0032972E2E
MSRKSRLVRQKSPISSNLPEIYVNLTIFSHDPSNNRAKPMDQDRNLLVQAEMMALIEGIPSSLVEEHPVQFLLHLDQIRQKAEQHKLAALHDLSCAFESALQQALQTGSGMVTAKAYLGGMKDALACEPTNREMTEALMANVALRLGGQP